MVALSFSPRPAFAGAVSNHPVLNLAGTYRRRVNASLARIWENVFDWEHLSHLHDGSFSDCALIEAGPWGWRIALTGVGGSVAQVIEMRADRGRNRYTATTLEGTGAGTEIRVVLALREFRQVDVAVEFYIPETRPGPLKAIGDAYVDSYAQLWDEDEAMMVARERALALRFKPDFTVPSLDLGAEHAVRAQLPLLFELGGAPFRLVDLEGELVAHSTVCPHWLGPLDQTPVIDGAIRCPWHGYRFTVASGSCLGHAALKLLPAPSIRIIHGLVVADWRSAHGRSNTIDEPRAPD